MKTLKIFKIFRFSEIIKNYFRKTSKSNVFEKHEKYSLKSKNGKLSKRFETFAFLILENLKCLDFSKRIFRKYNYLQKRIMENTQQQVFGSSFWETYCFFNEIESIVSGMAVPLQRT